MSEGVKRIWVWEFVMGVCVCVFVFVYECVYVEVYISSYSLYFQSPSSACSGFIPQRMFGNRKYFFGNRTAGYYPGATWHYYSARDSSFVEKAAPYTGYVNLVSYINQRPR